MSSASLLPASLPTPLTLNGFSVPARPVLFSLCPERSRPVSLLRLARPLSTTDTTRGTRPHQPDWGGLSGPAHPGIFVRTHHSPGAAAIWSSGVLLRPLPGEPHPRALDTHRPPRHAAGAWGTASRLLLPMNEPSCNQQRRCGQRWATECHGSGFSLSSPRSSLGFDINVHPLGNGSPDRGRVETRVESEQRRAGVGGGGHRWRERRDNAAATEHGSQFRLVLMCLPQQGRHGATEEGGGDQRMEKLREGSVCLSQRGLLGQPHRPVASLPVPGLEAGHQGPRGGSGRNLPGSLLCPAWWTGRHFLLL